MKSVRESMENLCAFHSGMLGLHLYHVNEWVYGVRYTVSVYVYIQELSDLKCLSRTRRDVYKPSPVKPPAQYL